MGEMQDQSDAQLLRAFAERADQAAFRELVTRHTDFVYSAALRQVESSAIAGDLAQSVFTDLARKAQSLAEKITGDSSLAGWLHRSTRYAALNHLRDARRRRENERQAMEQLLTNSDSAADWEQIRPALDEALDSLAEEDREALLLRYFKNHDFCAVGHALGVSDDTAQKRVSRAVERLREFFAKRGVTVGAGGLVIVISANAVQAAPIGLAATISAAAVLTGTLVSTSTVIAATKTIAMTTLQKTIITAAFVAAAGAGIFEARQAAQLREQNQTLQQAQAPLADQIQQLQKERDGATNRLASLAEEIAKIKSNNLELLKLRSEVTRLRANLINSAPATDTDPNNITATMAKTWSDKVNLLKDYLQRNPNEAIPEIQFIQERDWLSSIDPSAPYWPLKTDDDYRQAVDILRDLAQLKFHSLVSYALIKFSKETKRSFPTDLSELRPYLDLGVADVLDQQWEMVLVSNLPANAPHATETKSGDWMIARKSSARERGQRMIIVPVVPASSNGYVSYEMSYY